jgi:lysylphosphatidylglycerol synthetase-like protein (DUF2156 family)
VWFVGTFLILIVAIAVTGFALANAANVIPELVLWDVGVRWALDNVSVPRALVGAFAAGALVIVIGVSFREISCHRRLRALERRRRLLEAELAALRQLPLDDALPRIVEQDGGR